MLAIARATHTMYTSTTFDFPELIKSFESCSIVDLVGVERNSEEAAVGIDGAHQLDLLLRPTKSGHLAVDQADVEVGKFYVVTLSLFRTTSNQQNTNLKWFVVMGHFMRGWGVNKIG